MANLVSIDVLIQYMKWSKQNMDMSGDENFDDGMGNSFPNYWAMFKDYTIGDLKTSAQEQIKKDLRKLKLYPKNR